VTKFAAILFCAATALPAAGAENGVTLSVALAEARAANPALALAHSRLAVLEAGAVTAAAYPNPSLEAVQAAPGEAGFTEVKLVQPVPLTRSSRAAGAAASAAAEAAGQELAAFENTLASSVRKAWYALLIAKERRNFEENHLKSSMDIQVKIGQRLETGEAGNSDLARAKVEVVRGGLHLREAEAAVAAAAGELNALMGRRPDEPLTLAGNAAFSLTPELPALGPLEKYTALALERRPELHALALNGKAADLETVLQRGRRLPVPELGFIRGREGGVGYSRLFLGLELPLWYGGKSGVNRALAQRASVGLEGKLLELQLRREVYDAWLQLDLARARLAAARETVFLLNDLRRSAAQDYLSGKTGLAAFYETNRVFLEENLSYLDALKEYYEKTAQLGAATNGGEEI
jgi:outer membrane protein TolC